VAGHLTGIDLFCGAGGLSEGLRQAGYRVLGAAELDELACRTYALNHPTTKLWRIDIQRLSGDTIREELGLARGELDLLAACPPCQGFSRMRTRNGGRRNQDARNRLLFEVLRLARSLRPRTLMVENVPGLSRSVQFERFVSGIVSEGFLVKWRILDASEFGVPQRRKRLVLLATMGDELAFAKPARKKVTVRDFLEQCPTPEESNDPIHNYQTRRSDRVQALISKIPKDGGSRAALGAQGQLSCHKRTSGFFDVYGRMAWDRPAPTITGGCTNPSKGRFLHPAQDRPITLREAAILQTFPRRYRFIAAAPREQNALLIGNALPPEFVRRQADALARVTPDG
jgi:DNA (cytosine-5)-methyltransferase 1